MEWRFLAGLFMSLTLLLLGLSCLFSPKAIQGYALKHKTNWWFTKNTFFDWMETPKYLLYLRVMGAVVSVIGTFATVIFARKWFESWFI